MSKKERNERLLLNLRLFVFDIRDLISCYKNQHFERANCSFACFEYFKHSAPIIHRFNQKNAYHHIDIFKENDEKEKIVN